MLASRFDTSSTVLCACRAAREDLSKGEERGQRKMFRFPVPISKDWNGLPPMKTSRTLGTRPLDPMNSRSHQKLYLIIVTF